MDKKYQWDLTKFCKDIPECESRLAQLTARLDKLAQSKGKLGDEDILLKFWEQSHELINDYDECYIYAFANLHVDYLNKDYQLLTQKVANFGALLSDKLSFVDAELKSLGNDYLSGLLQKDKFADWGLYIDRVMNDNEHTLSEDEERILAQVSKFSKGFTAIQENCYNADIQYEPALDSEGKEHKVTGGNASSYFYSTDRELRRNVANSQLKAMQKYANSMAQTFIHQIITNVTLAKIRHYNSVLDRSLSGKKMHESVYNNVIDYTVKNQDLLQKYFSTKKKLLGFDTMYSYDILVGLDKSNKKYTFEEGVSLIKEALSILGDDYVKMIDRAISERWVDVYPRDNKRGGGYCWGSYGKTNIILLNWADDLDSVFTLAHELGHAIHHYTIDQHQKIQNNGVPIFCAEVASTFNESILANYLLHNCKDDSERLILLDKQMLELVGVVYRQVEFSRFEDFCYKSIEQDKVLNLEILEQKWREYRFGPYEGVVDMSTASTLSWENLWHYYNASYYVWQYALAHMISSHFARQVIEQKPNALSNYFEFLSGGHNEYMVDLLKRLGVDIHNDAFYKNAFAEFRRECDEFVALAERSLSS